MTCSFSWMSRPTLGVVGVRIVGAIEGEQTEKDGTRETNDRLLAVAVHSYSHQDAKTISEIDGTLLDQLEAFFVNYNKSRGKKYRVRGRCGSQSGSQVSGEIYCGLWKAEEISLRIRVRLFHKKPDEAVHDGPCHESGG